MPRHHPFTTGLATTRNPPAPPPDPAGRAPASDRLAPHPVDPTHDAPASPRPSIVDPTPDASASPHPQTAGLTHAPASRRPSAAAPLDLALSRPQIHVPGRDDPDAPHHVAVLRIHDPRGGEEILLVDRPVLHIGSDRGACGLVLTGPGVAATHCCLRWSGRRWLLHDRGAPAGTYVNDRRCREPTALCSGDRIAVVHHRIAFSLLPSLALPHVLARLRDRPIVWRPPTPAQPTAPSPRALPPPHVALLAAVAALLVTLVLLAPTARSTAADPTAPPDITNPDLSSAPAPSAADPTPPPDITHPDLSPAPAPSAADPTPPPDITHPDLSSAPAPSADLEPPLAADARASPLAHPGPSTTVLPPATPLTSRPAATARPLEAPAADLSRETPPADRPTAPAYPIKKDLSRGTPRPAAPLAYVTEPPAYELPSDAIGLGRPTDGALLNALQLPPSPDYTIRCPALAHGTTATIAELMHALGAVRNRGYRGELVVGDLSRADGGKYGPHKSHQSGRDVDLWLPIRGGRYARGCPRCGGDLCRPEPGDVDWPATWRLIEALAERGAVADIFLDWTLQPALRDAARALGVPEEELARKLQFPVRGRGSLIKHADGHVHHIHVRFRDLPPDVQAVHAPATPVAPLLTTPRNSRF